MAYAHAHTHTAAHAAAAAAAVAAEEEDEDIHVRSQLAQLLIGLHRQHALSQSLLAQKAGASARRVSRPWSSSPAASPASGCC
jgi:hypothetical protein